MRGVIYFGKKGKLSSSYVGPYKILKLIEKVTYELELLMELVVVHAVFHVSMFRKFLGDSSLVPLKDVSIEEC